MREILFRGKDIDTKEWLIGHYNRIAYCDGKGLNSYIKRDGYAPFEVDDNTIGQYIGLQDKNGTKIFEGDILRISIKDSDDKIEYKFGAVEFSDKTLGYIIRSKGGLMCSFNTILNSAGFYEFELEVIGNIYDNRNLLE